MTASTPILTFTPPRPSRSRQYICDTPRDEDGPQLQRLYALSMPGPISLSLRAEPDYRMALNLQGDRHDTVVIRRRSDGQVIAMGSRSVRPLWINGEVQRVGYLSGLRNSPGVRLPRRLVAEAFDWLLSQRRPDEAGFDLTSILADNHPARRALERGVKGMPCYTPIGRIDTLTLRVTRRKKQVHALSSLVSEDIPAIQTLLNEQGPKAHARPVWRVADSRSSASGPGIAPEYFVGYKSNTDLIGCAALWDQRPLKQAVVEDLSQTLKRWRPAINAGCRLSGRAGLPKPGEVIRSMFASHLAYPDEQPWVLRRLLCGLQAEAGARGADAVVVGITPAQRRDLGLTLRCKAWTTPSVIYAVHRGDQPFFDARPVWPEVAVL